MKNKRLTITKQIREGIYNALRIWVREFQLIFSDVGVMVVIFAIPLLYPLLYSLIYYPEVVRDLPVAVVDRSQSSESRNFIRNLNATPEMLVASNCASMQEAITLFKKREIRGIVQIPQTFSADIALERSATVSVYADMEFFLYYKALATGTNLVALETGNQLRKNNLSQHGLTIRQAEVTAEPFKIVANSISNRAGGFASYGIPASLILIIQQTLILGIGMLGGTARERHPLGTLVPFDRKRMGTLRLILGKTAAYFTIYAMLCVYVLGIIPQLFGYGRSADLSELTALITPFLLSAIFFGLTLSVFFKNRESAMMLYLFTSIPLLFLSGVIWPLSDFSNLWRLVREVFPSSNAIFGYIKMSALGADIRESSREIMALWIQSAVYFITACLAYGYQVSFSEKLRSEVALNPFREIRAKLSDSKAYD